MIDRKKLYKVMATKEFSKILAEDKRLDELETMIYDKNDDFFDFALFSGSLLKIQDIPVQPITPMLWSFLWTIGNSFCYTMKERTKRDIDIIFYLLCTGFDASANIKDLEKKSLNFVEKKGLDYDAVAVDIYQVISLMFRPLRMINLARKIETSKENVYDVAWCIWLCSLVAKETGKTFEDVQYKTSLNTCYYVYLNYMRRESSMSIEKVTDEEIQKMIMDRTFELGEEFYKKKEAENGN